MKRGRKKLTSITKAQRLAKIKRRAAAQRKRRDLLDLVSGRRVSVGGILPHQPGEDEEDSE